MAVKDWSTTPSTNATADADEGINWSEGQAPGTLNDSARAMMAEIKEWYDTAPVAFSAYLATNQNVFNGTATVNWTEALDTDSAFASNRFTAPVAGNYLISATVTHASATAGQGGLALKKNGVVVAETQSEKSGAFFVASCSLAHVIALAEGDYVEAFWTLSSVTGGTPVIQAGRCIFSGHLINK